MISNNTSSDIIGEFHPLDGFIESLDYANQRISELEKENSRIHEIEDRISKLEARTSKLEARINKLENQIYRKNKIFNNPIK